MKKQVTDIQAIHVELDDDDRELMTMFRSRQRIMNDVLLVQESNEMYIVSKADIARQRRMIQDVFDFSTIAIAVFVILLQTILMVKRVVNPLSCLPWMAVVIAVYMVTRFYVRKYRKNESTMQRLQRPQGNGGL